MKLKGLWQLANSIIPFDDSLARHCAILSSAAYGLDEMIGNWTFPNPACNIPEFEIFHSYADPSKSAYGYVGVDHTHEAIVVAFQGTVDRVDWITDLSTWLRYGYECKMPALNSTTPSSSSRSTSSSISDTSPPSSYEAEYEPITHYDAPTHASAAPTAADNSTYVSLGYVHHGFCDYYRTLASMGLPQLVITLAEKHKHYSIILTGHSLGGAAATVAAADLAIRFEVPRERLRLYTFGAPRPGDGGFASTISENVGAAYRVVHARDIVPHLAPCCHGWFGGCDVHRNCPYHAATEVWYNNDMTPGQNYTVCGFAGEDRSCDNVINLSVQDHEYYFSIKLGGYCNVDPAAPTSLQTGTPTYTHDDSLRVAAIETALQQTGAWGAALQSLKTEHSGIWSGLARGTDVIRDSSSSVDDAAQRDAAHMEAHDRFAAAVA